jgi:lipopolysaccharide/colanic/teichoic acid biosynthesis glycosyltransferase
MQLKLKRAIDFTISGILLIVLSPLLLAVTIIIYLTMGRPAVFRHRRPGLHEKIFTLYKFRTMTDDRDKDGNLLPNEERLTRAGRIIRKLSLDELPQLWNVLKGDMSLVGPRPLLFDYLEHYSPKQRRRHDVIPGISGWAQVNGRNAISWEQKFELDVWYVDNFSIMLDLKIILMTVYKVIKRESISPEDREIMEKFMGSKSVSEESYGD